MTPDDLIGVARHLLATSAGRPKQAMLRRGVSTAYYAVFHELCRLAADRLVGTTDTASGGAWKQVYRALDHGAAKSRSEAASKVAFPTEIKRFALAFRDLQQQRHDADYDPDCRFSHREAASLVDRAEAAIADLRASTAADQTAFAVFVLLPKRSG